MSSRSVPSARRRQPDRPSRGRSTTRLGATAWPPSCAAQLSRRRARRAARRARIADPAGVWRDLQERLGVDVFEVPTLPPSVAGMRVYRTLRDALRARRRADRHQRRRRSAPSARAAASPGVARRASAARAHLRRALGRARHAAAWRRAAWSWGPTGGRARPCSAWRCAARPSRASRGSWPTTSPSSRWPARASPSTRDCEPRARPTCSLRRRPGGGEPVAARSPATGIALATGYARPRRRARGRGRRPRGDRMTSVLQSG